MSVQQFCYTCQKVICMLISTVFYTFYGLKFIFRILCRYILIDPFLLLHPGYLVKAWKLSLKTGIVVATVQLECVRWSAGNLKTLFVKACSTTIYGQKPTQECLEKDEDCIPLWMQEDINKHRNVLKMYNTRFNLLKRLPLRAFSRLWGNLAKANMPRWLMLSCMHLYSYLTGCQPEEAVRTDISKFKNLEEFFRRKIKPHLRPIAREFELTSPCDGTVLHCGEICDGAIEQVKGVTYSLQGFTGPPSGLCDIEEQQASKSLTDHLLASLLVKNKENKLYACTIYLAPGDYHCFHSPTNWKVSFRRHFPGELFSVNPSLARWLQGLFSMNERVLYAGSWKHGFFSMTPVGATCVGSIKMYCDMVIENNPPRSYKPGYYMDKDLTSGDKKKGINMKPGELIGEFNLGSTIVLIFEAPASWKFNVTSKGKVKVGQALGNCS